MDLNIAFIGFGEVGQLFGRQLAACPGVTVTAWDILFGKPESGDSLRRVAADSGVRAAASPGDACRGAEFVISAVTADSAVTAAAEASAGLASSQVYVDLNSISPATKARVAAQAGRSGAAFVEFAVMAPVEGPGIRVPILSGGERAEEVSARLNGLGMNIKAVSREIGVASASKLCRSIVIKGMEALMVDFTLAAERAGVKDNVLASLEASYPGMDWDALARTMIARVKRHGVRRAAEMREASRMMTEFGLDGSLAEAIAGRHEAVAREAQGPGSSSSGPSPSPSPSTAGTA
jgi:3-hydroxyisobutyrate dehydrogenase-like beta-hydroxyacid dehydrogenase